MINTELETKFDEVIAIEKGEIIPIKTKDFKQMLKQKLGEWKPRCFEKLDCKDEHTKKVPTHGARYTCQDCGYDHDDCICKYFEEPCMSCIYKEI